MVRTLLKPFSFLPALLLMYVIYNFSAQPADVSSQLSFQVSCKIVETADYVFDANLEQWEIEDYATRIHFITRKLAHMTIYFALAVAVSFPLYVYGVHGIWLMLLAGLICVGFACGDEYHQSFVDGRSPSPKDVAIDSFGVFWGIILVRIIGWTGRKTIFRPRKKKNVKKEKQKISRQQAREPEYRYYQEMPPQGMPYPRQTSGTPYRQAPDLQHQPMPNTQYRKVPDPQYRSGQPAPYMPYRQGIQTPPRQYQQAAPGSDRYARQMPEDSALHFRQEAQEMPRQYQQAQNRIRQPADDPQDTPYRDQASREHDTYSQQMPLDAPYQQFQDSPDRDPFEK